MTERIAPLSMQLMVLSGCGHGLGGIICRKGLSFHGASGKPCKLNRVPGELHTLPFASHDKVQSCRRAIIVYPVVVFVPRTTVEADRNQWHRRHEHGLLRRIGCSLRCAGSLSCLFGQAAGQ